MGAVVTLLDWRPHNAAWKPALLVLNVTLPFVPLSVESALHGALHWVPVVPAPGGGFYSGLVEVEAPPTTHGADLTRPRVAGLSTCSICSRRI